MSQDNEVPEWHAPMGFISTSIYLERVALTQALRWQVIFPSSPQSTHNRPGLQETAADITVDKHLLVIWVVRHGYLPGNELADTQARLRSSVTQPVAPADDTTRRALIQCERRRCHLERPRLNEFYTTDKQ